MSVRNTFAAAAIVVMICAGFQTVEAQPDRPDFGRRSAITIDYSTMPEEWVITQADADADMGAPGFPDPIPDELVGTVFDLHEKFRESQRFFDRRLIGYRDDMPRLLENELTEGGVIRCALVNQDGLYGVLAFARPVETVTFGSTRFNVFSEAARRWSVMQLGEMSIDIPDISWMLATDEFVATIVHEAMHAIGFGSLFEANGLNGVINLFGQRGYTWVGFALKKYRVDAQLPFAQFIPLQNGGGHWSPFDPYFNQTQNQLRDVMHPEAAPPDWTIIYTDTTWSVFADLGYRVRAINAPGLPGQ